MKEEKNNFLLVLKRENTERKVEERKLCVVYKMADKIRRQALTLQENEELAEVIRRYPCLYDKSRKEYKDKNVAENAWKEVVNQLDFIESGESYNFSYNFFETFNYKCKKFFF